MSQTNQISKPSFLGTEPIPVLMRKYSVPCIISLLVAALYNIVDQIFIANASYLGSYGNAANTVVFPLTVVALALAVMVGDGTCTFVSQSLGKGDSKTAGKAIGNAVSIAVIIAAVATVLGQILTAVLAIWYICNLKSCKLEKTDFILKGSILRKSLILGITSFLSQISLVCAMAAINQMIQKYSPEFAVNAAANDPTHSPEQLTQIPMAVVGIVMKFFQIVISVSVGMAAGCIPLVGYNIGAGRKDRAAELYKLLLIYLLESFLFLYMEEQ